MQQLAEELDDMYTVAQLVVTALPSLQRRAEAGPCWAPLSPGFLGDTVLGGCHTLSHSKLVLRRCGGSASSL